jgi:hypothetical protein
MSKDEATQKLQQEDPWRANDEARLRRLQEDAQRPMAVNLAEGLALSEFLSTYTGDAKTPEEQLEAFRAAQRDAASGD